MKQITAKNQYPYKFDIYDDGSVAALCIECNQWKDMPEETFKKFSRIPLDISEQWTSNFKCMDCFKKSIKSKTLLKPMDEQQLRIRTGQAINLAHAEWLGGFTNPEIPMPVKFDEYAKHRVPDLVAIINQLQNND